MVVVNLYKSNATKERLLLQKMNREASSEARERERGL